MNQPSLFKLRTPASYLTLLFWAFLIVFAGKFIIKDALPYFGFEQEVFGKWWEFKMVAGRTCYRGIVSPDHRAISVLESFPNEIH